MFKYIYYAMILCFSFISDPVVCMDSGHFAASCIDILNSTGKDIQLSYVSVDGDTSLITKKPLNTSSAVEISPNVEFTLAEQFSDFNQFAAREDSDVMLQKIEVRYGHDLVGYIYLMCSMFCPDPYYAFEGVINNCNVWLHKTSISRGGGPAVLEISQQK